MSLPGASSVLASWRLLLLDRLLPAGLWAWFSGQVAWSVWRGWEVGASWLVLANRATALLFVALMTALFLVRRQRRGGPAPLGGRCVALAGTFLPLWILALPLLHLNPILLTASVLVGWAGLAWSIVSLAVLGRCFGLFPEVRGLVMRGPYALVRHPLYLGEIVTMLGIVGPLLSWRAGIAFALWVGLQVWRALNEEAALARQFSEYRSYMRRTRRLVPWVW